MRLLNAITICLSLLATAPLAFATGILTEVTPKIAGDQNTRVEFTAKPLGAEEVAFEAVITYVSAPGDTSISAGTGTVEQTETSRAVGIKRALPLVAEDGKQRCRFTVSRSDLQQPNFCFILQLQDNKHPFVHYYYAKLAGFAPATAVPK